MNITEQFLSNRFDELNATYFDGEVPRPCAFLIDRSKNSFGQCMFFKNHRDIYLISISGYYDRPEQDVTNTLLHEMIHAYLWGQGSKDYNKHTGEFLKLADQLNRKGFSVFKTGSSKGLLSSREQNINLIVSVSNFTGDRFVMACSNKSREYFINLLQNNQYTTYSVKLRSKKYASLPICRKRVLGKYIDQEEFNNLIGKA